MINDKFERYYEEETEEIIKSKKTSPIELVFDNKLVLFIKDTKEIFKDELFCLSLNTTEFSSSMEIQRKIRNYIIKNQDKITMIPSTFRLSTGIRSYPVMFALFIHIISNINLCNEINDCMRQIHQTKLISPVTNLEYDEDAISQSYSECACGHTCNIENIFLVTNIHTLLKCYIGCDCILKKELVTKEILKIYKDDVKNTPYCINKKYHKDHPDQPRCDICNKLHRNTDLNRCNPCRIGRCNGCKQDIDKKYELCLHCYQCKYPNKCCDICKIPHSNTDLNRCNPCRIGRCNGCKQNIDQKYELCYFCNKKKYKETLTRECLECKTPIKSNYKLCFKCKI